MIQSPLHEQCSYPKTLGELLQSAVTMIADFDQLFSLLIQPVSAHPALYQNTPPSSHTSRLEKESRSQSLPISASSSYQALVSPDKTSVVGRYEGLERSQTFAGLPSAQPWDDSIIGVTEVRLSGVFLFSKRMFQSLQDAPLSPFPSFSLLLSLSLSLSPLSLSFTFHLSPLS